MNLILTQILGLSLFIISFAVIYNKDAFETFVQLSRSKGFNLLLGVIFLSLGIAIVVLHNRWVWQLDLFLTITGWLFLIEGLIRLLFVKQLTDIMLLKEAKIALLASFYFLFFLGLVLIVISFF